MGDIVYLAHKRIDRMRAKKLKKCACSILFCKYIIKELNKQMNTRPFRNSLITQPRIIGGRKAQASEKDQLILTRLGLLAGSVACSDHYFKPQIPKSMDQYTQGAVVLSSKSCQIYAGRFLQHKFVVNLMRHIIR